MISFPTYEDFERLELLIKNTNKLQQEILTKMSALDDKITQLQSDVTAENTVIDSAITLINGFQAQLQAAIQQALANGATVEQLQSLTDLSASIEAKDQALATAVAANTPSTGTATATK